MLRWLKKKWARHSSASVEKRLSRSSRVEEPTESEYHIYEEIPDIRIPPQEVAYAVVSISRTFDDFILDVDNDCPVCLYGCLDMDVPCVCQDHKMKPWDSSDLPTMHHSSSVMTIDKNLPRLPWELPPCTPKGESFLSLDSSSGYDSNTTSSSDIGIDDDFIKRLDNMHVQQKSQNKFIPPMEELNSLQRKQFFRNRPLPELPHRPIQRRPLSFRKCYGQAHQPSMSRTMRRSSKPIYPCYEV